MHTRIAGYTFTISEPFQAGTVITKGEAQALNTLRLENIANNLRKLIAKAQAGLSPADDGIIPAQVLEAIQAEITQYDLAYQFLEKNNSRSKLGDIEEEARVIARERIEAMARQEGLSEPPYSVEQLDQLVLEQAELPAIKEEARMRVSARRRVLGEGLESL